MVPAKLRSAGPEPVARRHGCVLTSPLGRFWFVGAAPGDSEPNFRSIVRHGNELEVTSTYKYIKSSVVVSEIGTINASTLFFIHSVYHLSGSAVDKPITYPDSFFEPESLPVAPQLHVCA